jgi:hypothetical protein
MSVIAVLIALIVPALSSSRASAHRIKSTSNARVLAGVITEYQAHNSDFFPRIDENRWYVTPLASPFRFPFWQVFETWVAAVNDYMPTAGYKELVLSPASRAIAGTVVQLTSYHYSWSFVCPPAFWDADARDLTVRNRGVRSHNVVFPSRKALLWDNEVRYEGRSRRRDRFDLLIPAPIAFVDNSVRLAAPSDATTPVHNPEFWPDERIRLLSTEDGVAGVDY